MNLLIDNLPLAVEVDGRFFNISTDFRSSIKFEQLILNPDIENKDKAIKALQIYFPNLNWMADYADSDIIYISQHAESAISACCGFYSGPQEIAHRGKITGSKKRLYDYEYDSAEIYASFLSDYGINLSTTNMHWWMFHQLFTSLSDESPIKKIMAIRNTKISSKMAPEEKQRLKKLKSYYKLPERISAAELAKQKELENVLLHGGDLESVLKK